MTAFHTIAVAHEDILTDRECVREVARQRRLWE